VLWKIPLVGFLLNCAPSQQFSISLLGKRRIGFAMFAMFALSECVDRLHEQQIRWLLGFLYAEKPTSAKLLLSRSNPTVMGHISLSEGQSNSESKPVLTVPSKTAHQHGNRTIR